MADTGAVMLLVIVGLVFYFLPAFIASSRGHHNSGALFVANLLAGWTFIGWVICLVWSLTNQKEEQVVTINNTTSEDSSTVESSVADELNKLLKLKDSGVLTDEEFKLQKDKLLK